MASAVVVAVPLNTLAMIDFSPALGSEKQAVADRGPGKPGHQAVGARSWGPGAVLLHGPDHYPLTFLATEKVLDDGSQLLVAFGPDAERLRPGDEQEVRRAIGERLPGGVEIMAVTGHDWCAMSSPAAPGRSSVPAS